METISTRTEKKSHVLAFEGEMNSVHSRLILSQRALAKVTWSGLFYAVGLVSPSTNKTTFFCSRERRTQLENDKCEYQNHLVSLSTRGRETPRMLYLISHVGGS